MFKRSINQDQQDNRELKTIRKISNGHNKQKGNGKKPWNHELIAFNFTAACSLTGIIIRPINKKRFMGQEEEIKGIMNGPKDWLPPTSRNVEQEEGWLLPTSRNVGQENLFKQMRGHDGLLQSDWFNQEYADPKWLQAPQWNQYIQTNLYHSKPNRCCPYTNGWWPPHRNVCRPHPTVCTEDVRQCPDGSYVGRNPFNNCHFYPCSEKSAK